MEQESLITKRRWKKYEENILLNYLLDTVKNGNKIEVSLLIEIF